MKKNKHLDPIIDQAIKGSFKDGKLMDSQVERLMTTFKKLPRTEAIYLVSGFLKGLKREVAKTTLTVESAIPLSSIEMNQIKKQLSTHYTLTTTHSVLNPELLGGIKARVADTVYDFSLKGKLQQVKEAIHG